MKTLFIVTLLIAGMLTTYTQACTRVVYLGKNGMVFAGSEEKIATARF